MTLELESRTAAGPETYRFRTRDGLRSTEEFRAETLLALEGCWEADLGELLVVQANYGVLGVVLAARADDVTMTESSARAADTCRENVRENGVDATVRTLARESDLDGGFDTAVYVPKPYTALDVGKERLAGALDRLDSGGTLFLAARETTGLNRYSDCLSELRADPETVTAADGAKLVRATRPESFDPPVYVERQTHATAVDGTALELVTEPGLFAAGGLDDGTRLLLESVDVDVDGEVVTADCLAGVRGRSFDLVLSNPPTHAGSSVLATLFDGAADVLGRDGRFAFVHHRELDLSEHFGAFDEVQEVATGPEHVIRVARPR
ncbi:rRNA (guanine-N2)-methyltransferase [Halobacteriales archaeon QH_6_68_27]|nr:MAG: rRNA (guanine-N2)-methyltransferase [Halobacteriales archaeon QH_6_68_27]